MHGSHPSSHDLCVTVMSERILTPEKLAGLPVEWKPGQRPELALWTGRVACRAQVVSCQVSGCEATSEIVCAIAVSAFRLVV